METKAFSNMKLFACNSHPELAKEIADLMGVELGKATVSKFSDGEISVSIWESVRDKDLFIMQSTGNPLNDNLMELLIMVDAMKRASAGSINAVIPYYGYARQDRKAKARDPITAKLVADLITAAGADRVLTMDLHAAQIQGFFDIPVDHLLGVPIMIPHFIEKIGDEQSSYTIVSPDLGSVTRARKFAERCDVPLAIIDKRRPKANVSEVMNIIGDVRGRKVIIVDDMIDTAGTLCNAAKALVEIGGATDVIACATHGVLSGPALERIENSVLKEVVLLDTIPLPKDCNCSKITQLPVAPVFAEAIERIYQDKPVSPLFV